VIGTSGVPVEILRQRLDFAFFKPLWEARNTITNEANTSPKMPQYNVRKA